jgi:hypothetical protein
VSLLWKTAMAREAMPWQVHHGEEDMADHAVHVKDAGFAGFVSHSKYHAITEKTEPRFNHKIWNEVEPEPTDEDFHHFDQHGEFTPEHTQRHHDAYGKRMAEEHARDTPDHVDNDVTIFQHGEGLFPSTWENKGHLGSVDISGPVHATQSHVNQAHVERYLDKPDDKSWWEQRSGRTDETGYKGTQHPLFVTHQGRLHVIEGHHRVAAALQRGDKTIHGWHYDLDKHPI